jgi:hypothetical protein
MPGNPDLFDDSDLDQRGFRDDEIETATDDREHRVARRLNPLPSREEEEAELAEADILEELDLDEIEDSEEPLDGE